MTITTTYTCDHCGASQTKPEQMWHVGVCIKPYPTMAKFAPWDSTGLTLWCRACVDKPQLLGFPRELAKKEPPIPEITLEEKLREIIRDEIKVSQGR